MGWPSSVSLNFSRGTPLTSQHLMISSPKRRIVSRSENSLNLRAIADRRDAKSQMAATEKPLCLRWVPMSGGRDSNPSEGKAKRQTSRQLPSQPLDAAQLRLRSRPLFSLPVRLSRAELGPPGAHAQPGFCADAEPSRRRWNGLSGASPGPPATRDPVAHLCKGQALWSSAPNSFSDRSLHPCGCPRTTVLLRRSTAQGALCFAASERLSRGRSWD
jgi:hypothetical protein